MEDEEKEDIITQPKARTITSLNTNPAEPEHNLVTASPPSPLRRERGVISGIPLGFSAQNLVF